MPRQKTKHAQISSEKVRKSTFKRRLDSFFKKGKELSILCGVEVVIIVQDPEDGHSTMWPSQAKVMHGVMKFSSVPERERLRKMVLHEKFLMDKLRETTENLWKLQRKNENTEVGFLMNQLIDGTAINELDMTQLKCLDQFVAEKLKSLQSRNDESDEVQGQLSMKDISRHYHPSMTMATIARRGQEYGATSIATLLEDMKEEVWFGGTTSGVHNNLSFFERNDAVPEPTEVKSFNEGN